MEKENTYLLKFKIDPINLTFLKIKKAQERFLKVIQNLR